MMIATFNKDNDILTAIYEHTLNHSVNDVWAYLTENNMLQQWFPELEIQELKRDGEILFNLGDGEYERMQITEVVPKNIFSFTWDKNAVCFELNAKESGCLLIFKEYLNEVTAHTPKDLAGWHVCLDVIEALLDGRSIADRKALWEACYPKYEQAVRDAKAAL